MPNTAKTRKRSTQTSAPRKRTRSPEPDLSGKERIFQAAQIHFQSHSYASTRVDDICRAAGMSKGAFYLHFRTKEEMMEELFREFFLRIKNEIDEFLRITPPSPLAALELFRKSLEVSQAQLHMTRLFFESMGAEISGPDHGLNRWVSSVFDDFDFIDLKERGVGVFISDVSGHGVPAALITAMLKMTCSTFV